MPSPTTRTTWGSFLSRSRSTVRCAGPGRSVVPDRDAGIASDVVREALPALYSLLYYHLPFFNKFASGVIPGSGCSSRWGAWQRSGHESARASRAFPEKGKDPALPGCARRSSRAGESSSPCSSSGLRLAGGSALRGHQHRGQGARQALTWLARRDQVRRFSWASASWSSLRAPRTVEAGCGAAGILAVTAADLWVIDGRSLTLSGIAGGLAGYFKRRRGDLLEIRFHTLPRVPQQWNDSRSHLRGSRPSGLSPAKPVYRARRTPRAS